MRSPTERDKVEFTGERAERRPYSLRTHLKILAVINVLAPALAMAASAGSLHWYSIAAACVTMPMAGLQWVTASVPHPSRVLIRLAIVATIISCAIVAALCLHRAMASSPKAVIFSLVAPVLVAAGTVMVIRGIAREKP